MKLLHVDFAPKRKLPAWVWHSLSAGLLMLSGLGGWNAWHIEMRRLEIDRAQTLLSKEINELTSARAAVTTGALNEPAYARDAMAVAAVAKFPIERVLHALERAQVEGVRLTSLDASSMDGMVKAEVEFSTHESLLLYIRELNTGEPKPVWVLQQAQSFSSSGLGSASITSLWTKYN